MKPLKPTMREKKRYLLVKGQNSAENIKKSLFEFLGVLGMSKTNLAFISKNKNFSIISVNREMLNQVRAGLCLSKERLVVENVSGTLKSLRKHTNKFKKVY